MSSIELKEIISFFKSVLSHFWIPILILILFCIFLRQLNIQDVEAERLVLGIIFGIVLGFGADIAKRGYDDLVQEGRLKKAAMRLLTEDAKDVYRTMWLWEKALQSSQTPPGIASAVPPALNLKYWNKLKENNDFLMLAAEEPFTSIFKKMWDFEALNEQIMLANTGDRHASLFAKGFYQTSIDEGLHKKLLLFFMDEQEIKTLDEQHIAASKERSQK
jgi:hypothetical protein